jgi:hypothetical protein
MMKLACIALILAASQTGCVVCCSKSSHSGWGRAFRVSSLTAEDPCDGEDEDQDDRILREAADDEPLEAARVEP